MKRGVDCNSVTGVERERERERERRNVLHAPDPSHSEEHKQSL